MTSYGATLHINPMPSSKYLATKSIFQAKAKKTVSFITTEKQKKVSLKEIGLQKKLASNIASLVALIRRAPREILKPPDTKTIRWAEIVIDQAIINFRFFTLIPVVGTLVGSILCFVEGCFLMLESYIEGFHIVTQNLDHGGTVEMVIEGIDVFLVGTATLTFGLGLYSMFIGFTRSSGFLARGSSRSTLFHPKMLSGCSSMNSISQAKSRLGHAVVMLLLAGALEKFKNVPLTTGLDLACFAGVLIFLSASMFLLSQLHRIPGERTTIEPNPHTVNFIKNI